MKPDQWQQVRAELARRQAQSEREALEARAHAQRLERERRMFELAVGPVTALPRHGRADLQLPRPAPLARQREGDEREALSQTMSDDFDVDSLLETDGELSYRRRELPPSVLHRLRSGEWALQAQIDLHGLRRDEAREALGHFLQQCSLRGLRCVRVVHGKGHGSPGREGVLRIKVRRWLVQREEVMAFVQARPIDGGAGALLVLLRG